MDNNQLAEAAKILGVSEDSISAMNDEIKNSMTAVFETVAIRSDEDKYPTPNGSCPSFFRGVR